MNLVPEIRRRVLRDVNQTKTRVGAELTEKRTINYGLSHWGFPHESPLLLLDWTLGLLGNF